MSITQTCQDIVDRVDDGLGCAVVDLESGLLLGVYTKVSYLSQSYLDAVAAAAVDMFRGRTVRAVEELLANERKVEPVRMIQEIQMSTERTYHFMTVLPNHKSVLAVLITGRRANLGTGWAALRGSLPKLDALCP
jgi:hypothetical protein